MSHDPTPESIQAAEKALLQKQQQEAANEAAYQKALNNLLLSPDFEAVFIDRYLLDLEAGYLAEVAKSQVDDLPIARQRWVDAVAMRKDLRQAIAEARQPH